MQLNFHMAPMLGITDTCYRDCYTKYYGTFDKATAPYVRTKQGQRFQESHAKDLTRQQTPLLTVPQILSNQADDFIHLAKIFFDMGFAEVNLNMGCPVPSAMGKGRGAGLLADPEFVKIFLSEIVENIPNQLCIKTRIGFDQDTQLLELIDTFNELEIKELCIHPRTASQKYSGQVNIERFQEARDRFKGKTIYSGDIHNKSNFEELQKVLPSQKDWTIGRGMLFNPNILNELRSTSKANEATYRDFLTHLYDRYLERDLGLPQSLRKIKTLLFYYAEGQNFDKKRTKAIKKSRTFLDLSSVL